LCRRGEAGLPERAVLSGPALRAGLRDDCGSGGEGWTRQDGRYDPAMSLYILFFIVPFVLGLVAQSRVKSTFARNLQVPVANGLSGAEVARRVLDANGLHDVPVEEVQGALSDHYDPRNKSVHLSSDVYRGRSIASTAVGAHEVGHAIQHAQAYAFFRFRSALFPAVSFASNIWFLFLIGGLFFQVFQFFVIAIALYSIAVLFQFVTLPL